MDISNKALAWLVVSAIVISLAGTMISLNKLGQSEMMTGFAIQANTSGQAQVSISTQTALTFSIATLGFGSGSINTTGSIYNCTMYISHATGATINKDTGCQDFLTENAAGGPLTLENSGNTIVNVTLNFSSNATNFIGGGGTPSPGENMPQFKFMVENNETGSCASLNASYSAWTDVTERVNLNICNGLLWQNTNDTIALGIYVSIPANTPQGTKTVNITAQGTG